MARLASMPAAMSTVAIAAAANDVWSDDGNARL
jgi:hypothetical protein